MPVGMTGDFIPNCQYLVYHVLIVGQCPLESRGPRRTSLHESMHLYSRGVGTQPTKLIVIPCMPVRAVKH